MEITATLLEQRTWLPADVLHISFLTEESRPQRLIVECHCLTTLIRTGTSWKNLCSKIWLISI